MEGWVKVWRKIIEWEWASSPNHLSVFMHLLMRSNFKPSSWRGENIGPGQILTGRKQLSKWTGLSEMQVRTVLKDLKKSKEITIKPTNCFSVISISKWDLYQADNQPLTNPQPHPKNANNIINNIYTEFSPDFFEGVIETPEKNLLENKPQYFRNPKDTVIELADSRSKTVHQKLADAGNYVSPEFLVIEYYNKVNKRNLKQCDSNYKQIRARLKEGFTVDQMKALIDHAAENWSRDAFWSRLNRPSTLFNGKMDEYLSQATDPRLKEMEEKKLLSELSQLFPGIGA